MAKNAPAKDTKEAEEVASGPPEFSEKDKCCARQWFAKAKELRERRDYDYAIECYINGLDFWTEAVEEGHMPLWSLAIQRHQVGGKKPGLMEGLKNAMTGKDPKKCLLNAEHLMAKDPTNAGYLDGVLKNANRADLPETLQWITPKVFDSMRKDKKPNMGRFKTFRQVLVEAGERANERGDAQFAAWCYEQAVNAIDCLIARNPTDMALKDEQRDLSGRLTIARGKYGEADSFRDSLQDADRQKLLHDAERAKQGAQTLQALIVAERAEYEANPTMPGKIHGYVDALLKPERRKEELIAIDVLTTAYEDSSNYSFKQRADDVRLKQLRRQSRHWKERAQKTGREEDRQQFRLAEMEERQTEVEIYRERVQKYPTDLRLKFFLGRTLFRSQQHDEAIPLLQEAQGDPRSRVQCQLMIGRAFFEKESYSQAADTLSEALEKYEAGGDETSKQMMYWLGRACEADGKLEEAKAVYGKLLRQDYNYADGDARKRHESLQ
ncbi:MAG: tetratricopeptide repeat protein, partial [Phycisphaerae bacterium]